MSVSHPSVSCPSIRLSQSFLPTKIHTLLSTSLSPQTLELAVPLTFGAHRKFKVPLGTCSCILVGIIPLTHFQHSIPAEIVSPPSSKL